MRHDACGDRHVRFSSVPLLLLGVFLLLSGCVDQEAVFPPPDPPTSAEGFLGYVNSQIDESQTICGQCHASKQSAWATTEHADAWEGLQSSGGAQEFCEGCHTTNQMGSTSTTEGGWLTTGDPRYHGRAVRELPRPGRDAREQPAERRTSRWRRCRWGWIWSSGCGECHEGTHHPFVSSSGSTRRTRTWWVSRRRARSARAVTGGRARWSRGARTGTTWRSSAAIRCRWCAGCATIRMGRRYSRVSCASRPTRRRSSSRSARSATTVGLSRIRARATGSSRTRRSRCCWWAARAGSRRARTSAKARSWGRTARRTTSASAPPAT